MSATVVIQGTKNVVAPGSSLKDVLDLFGVPEDAKITAGELELTREMNYRFVDGATIDISWKAPDPGASDGKVIRMAVYTSQIKILNGSKSGTNSYVPEEFKAGPTREVRRRALRVVDLNIETGVMVTVWEK